IRADLVTGVQTCALPIYFRELHRSADTLDIAERVRFLGLRNDVPALMRAADVYCQPNTDSEGFSLAFVEACLAGLPIVTSALGRSEERCVGNRRDLGWLR